MAKKRTSKTEGAQRLSKKAAGETVKTNLRSSYGYTDPDTGQRRFYGPGEVEVPGNLASALGIDPKTGMTQAQSRKAARNDRQATTTRTSTARRTAASGKADTSTARTADSGSDAADSGSGSDADTANADAGSDGG